MALCDIYLFICVRKIDLMKQKFLNNNEIIDIVNGYFEKLFLREWLSQKSVLK